MQPTIDNPMGIDADLDEEDTKYLEDHRELLMKFYEEVHSKFKDSLTWEDWSKNSDEDEEDEDTFAAANPAALYDESDFHSLTAGWAIANGFTPREAFDFATFVRYKTDMG